MRRCHKPLWCVPIRPIVEHLIFELPYLSCPMGPYAVQFSSDIRAGRSLLGAVAFEYQDGLIVEKVRRQRRRHNRSPNSICSPSAKGRRDPSRRLCRTMIDDLIAPGLPLLNRYSMPLRNRRPPHCPARRSNQLVPASNLANRRHLHSPDRRHGPGSRDCGIVTTLFRGGYV